MTKQLAPGWVWSPATRHRADDPVTVDDFYAYMPQHNYICRPSRQHWPAASVNARVPKVRDGEDEEGNPTWWKPAPWLDQNRRVDMMTWIPGEDELLVDQLVIEGGRIEKRGMKTYNLYRPPQLGAKAGDPTKAGPWQELLLALFDDGDVEHLIRWFAHRVQRPAEKLNHGLVLHGDQGIGKDSLLVPVAYGVGPWNAPVLSPGDLMGRFNGWVKSVMLTINEARDLGGGADTGGGVNRYAFYEHLKRYVTAPPDILPCEEKHLNRYFVPNCTAVIITTNHPDGVYLPPDDRRFFVAHSERTRADFSPTYWQRLYAWYEHDGIKHVVAYLYSVDLTGFDPKAPPPQTAGWQAMVAAGQSPENAEVHDALERLGDPDAVTLDRIAQQVLLSGDQKYADFLHDHRNRRQMPHRMGEVGYVVEVNPADKRDGHFKVDGRRQVVYVKRSLTPRERLAAVQRLLADGRGGGPKLDLAPRR